MIKSIPSVVKFGNQDIKSSTIFYYRKYVYACVNLRPVVPGHILLCPIRTEMKYRDLTEVEVMELWVSVKKICENLKKFYNTDSVHIAIQDGADAGQTIRHCHIHMIPVSKKFNVEIVDSEERQVRTEEEMEKEAAVYREAFVLN